jgi:signal transduction histidine kinase/CheY-like chemotaxis protein/methyl-accepting chemotaxis protein
MNIPSSAQPYYETRISFFRSMRGKLILLFLAVSLIPLTLVGWVAITQLYAAKAAANEVSDNYFPSIINLDNAELALLHIIEAQKNHIIAPDDATMRSMETEIKNQREILVKALAGFERTLDVGTETKAFEKFKAVLDDFWQTNDKVILLSQKNDDEKAQSLSIGTANDHFENALGLMKTMRETNVIGSEQAKIAADQAARAGVILTLITSLVITVIVVIVAFLVANSIAKPVLIVTEAARQLSTGNLKSTGIASIEGDKIITRRDEMGEIGRAFDALTRYFQEVIEDLVQVSQGLAAGNLSVIPQSEYRGDFIQIKNALETALSNQRQVIEDIVHVSQELAVGNLSVTPQSEYRGDFIQIKNAQETALSNQRQVIEDIVHVSQELAAGNLNVTPQSEYRGDFAQIKNAQETALSNQRQVIEDIVQVSQGLAAGNLSVIPQSEYRGDFIQIKNALEIALSNQRQVIEDIVHVSQGLAEGNLSITPQSEYQGDFAHIKNAQERALSNQRQVIENIVQVSQNLAGGHLSVSSQAIYRGDFVQIKKALETALSNLRHVIEDIVHVSQGLAEGTQNLAPQAEYQGDFVQIKNALETAAVKLAETTAKNATQDWLKTGQAQLNELMSGEQDIVKLGKKIISFLSTYIEAQVGLFYLLIESNSVNSTASLKRLASYAYTASDNRPTAFLVGEGLVGQAALEQKPICFSRRLEECVHVIQSGLADVLPNHVQLIPFFYENAVKGVIEIGSSEALTETRQAFLQQVMSSIGIAVNTAESRAQMQALLQQSQRQTEELQSQSEELQSQQEELQQVNEALQAQREDLETKQAALQQRNETLQSQSEELQSQSEELQTQQEELKQTNDALEERTKELERQKAEIQQKNVVLEQTQAEMEKARAAIETKAQELELASQYKSEFLANMSHELRTPLNSLLILAQLLANNKAGNLSDKQVEYAKTIHSAGSDLLTLINEILDLSKVEAGKIEVNAEEISLTDLVETVEQKFRLMASEKGLAFQISLADELPPVLNTDGLRLKQIINNLLSNAFKFTEKGEIQLEITSKSPESPFAIAGIPTFEKGLGNFMAFSVSDTGIGIPKDKQQVIFEAFQQVDGSTSRRFGGTGLGLSISRQLARLLGGELQLHSEEGKGSTFTLYLPQTRPRNADTEELTRSNTDVPQVSVPSQPVKPVPPATLAALKTALKDERATLKPENKSLLIQDDRSTLKPEDKSILIIEDDRKFSCLVMELAREKHFKCLIAEDGQTGLQLVEEYQPNAIILDIGLPQLDGWTVMEILKDNPDTRHIPVHFISAAERNSLEAKKRGAIGYLHKPVSMEQLGEAFNSIEKFLSKTVKNLLVVVDNEIHQQQIQDLVGGGDVQITLAMTTTTALAQLKETSFDCIILDMDIEQRSGRQLLEQMQQIDGLCQTPVITYVDRELTTLEEALLLQCADALPIKSVNSPERLLDEATLFLHQIEANLPVEKRQILRMVHDKEAILAKKKVLIVDDDARNTFALATVLEEKNMEVIGGNTGHEALELLEEHPDIAIVLMDIMMPEMDGYEAMREIRKQPRFRKLPIIALTAKAMKGDKTKCLEAGANDYLSKPVDTDQLISLMRVWLYR